MTPRAIRRIVSVFPYYSGRISAIVMQSGLSTIAASGSGAVGYESIPDGRHASCERDRGGSSGGWWMSRCQTVRSTAGGCEDPRTDRAPPRGVEQSQYTPGNAHREGESGTESGTPDADSTLINADLQLIIDAWTELPRSVQARILALVKAEEGSV